MLNKIPPIRNYDYLFIDLEFSGLTPSHEITEIGGLIVERDDFKILEEFSLKIKMRHPERADKDALKLSGYNSELWQDAIDIKEALKFLNKKTSGLIFVGFNFVLDWARLEKAFFDHNMEPPYHPRKLDVMSMAFSQFYHDKSIRNFGLSELCQYFQIPRGRQHSALEDALATYHLFLKLIQKS